MNYKLINNLYITQINHRGQIIFVPILCCELKNYNIHYYTIKLPIINIKKYQNKTIIIKTVIHQKENNNFFLN